MTPIVVLCPTRGRPERAAEMVESFRDTAVLFDTELVLVIDEDDRRAGDYAPLMAYRFGGGSRYPLQPSNPIRLMVLRDDETGDLVRATNTAAARVWDDDCIIGHVGDDHRFRTPGWDKRIAEALRTPGIAYGDDLLQGAALPTAPFISSSIPRALGWYALPTCEHAYIDNAWLTLGKAMGALRYLPDVVIEHMHPEAGKADWDDGYRKANDPALFARDRAAFNEWHVRHMKRDLRNLRREAVAA